MIREFLRRWLSIAPMDMPAWPDGIDWIDGEDEDDDENAREGFNDTFESDLEEDEEE